jgi:NAD(P)-dependent dehydrogenase (short-subunit alcohol dehydrogenase family)
MPSLKDKTVLIIGRGGGIARAIALAVSEEEGRVIAAGRHPDDLAGAYRGMDIGVEQVDVTDESSVTGLAGRLATVDHVVSTASARARGGYADLTASVVDASFATKVTGPLLLAKHLAGRLAPGGSFLFMSGATALKPAPGMLAVAATNAAVDAVTPRPAARLPGQLVHVPRSDPAAGRRGGHHRRFPRTDPGFLSGHECPSAVRPEIFASGRWTPVT